MEPPSQDALILESGQQVGRRDLCQNCWGEGCLVKGPLSIQNPHLRDLGAPTLCLGHFKEKFSSMNTQPVAREVWVVRVLLVLPGAPLPAHKALGHRGALERVRRLSLKSSTIQPLSALQLHQPGPSLPSSGAGDPYCCRTRSLPPPPPHTHTLPLPLHISAAFLHRCSSAWKVAWKPGAAPMGRPGWCSMGLDSRSSLVCNGC